MAYPIGMNLSGALAIEPRDYTVVQIPPSLPQDIELDQAGNVAFKHWSKQSANYTSRLSADGTSFEVRPINHNDTTGEGRFRPDDWPMTHHLGPPSMAPDFHPLIEKYGLQVLEAAGFINQKIPREPYNDLPIGPLHFHYFRNPGADINELIHPVFRKHLWNNTSDDLYKLLLPAILLATAVLDDPTTLSYFFALSEPTTQVQSTTFNTPCHVMMQPPALSDAQLVQTYNRVCALQNWTNWNWEVSEVTEFNRFGVTKSTEVNNAYVQASAPNTHQSEIFLSDQFGPQLLLYEQQARAGNRTYDTLQRAAGIPPNKMITILAEGVLARTTVTLAITILHEFVHAFGKAYFPKPVLAHPFEPWFPGKRTNEQGCSFEEFVFGGMIKSLNIWVPPMSLGWDGWQNISPAFGLWFDENEDQWFVHDPAGAQAIMNDYLPVDRSRPKKLWPIPQEWCQRLLTDGMWNDQVTRFGQRAYKLPRLEYWATYRWQRGGPGVWKTGQERWNAVPRDSISDTAPTWL